MSIDMAQEAYSAWKGMSHTKASESEENAEDAEKFTSVTDMIRTVDEDEQDTYNPSALRKSEVGEDGPIINTESVPYVHPENVGEQEISGSMPDPASDDDMLEVAQAVGTQLGETSEKPEEIDIGRDIDIAEEKIRRT